MDMTPFTSFDSDLRACRKCESLLATVPVDPAVSQACVRPRPVSPGISQSPVLLIGQAPGIDEYKTGLPFQGQAGQGIRGIFRTAGLLDFDRQVYSSAVVKCFPGRKLRKAGQLQSGSEDRVPSSQMVNYCGSFLTREIALVDPQIIVTLGSFPLKAILRLSGSPDKQPVLERYVGTTQDWGLRKIVFLPHTSGGSRWLNSANNKCLFVTAKQLLREVLVDRGVVGT